jgi:hypothetical protein
MPFKLNWQKVNEFENEKNLDLFLLTNVQTSTGKSNTVNCSMCADNGHDMIYKLRSCSSVECNKENECKFRYKVMKCCRTNKI